MSHSLPTLRRRLMTMVLLSTLPLVVCAAYALANLVRNEENQAFDRALETNRLTATAVRVTFSRSFAVLGAAAQSPLLDNDDLERFTDQMARVLPLMPNWQMLLISLPDGRIVSRVSPRSGTMSPALVEPESFARLLEKVGPTVGQMGKGPSGNWAIPVRVPAIRDGKIRYVLTAPLLPEAISSVLALSRLPEGWTISVFDNAGRRIARLPSLDRDVGSPVSAELAALVKAGGDEGSGITITTDGKEVYTAYLRLRDLGWTIATGIPTAEVTAKVTKALLLYGGGLALSAILACLGALYAARKISSPMEDLRKAALSVGRRELPLLSHARIAEIHEVAVALGQSAIALRASEDSRSEAMKNLATAHEALIEADKRKDVFIATLAHELRNPLAPVVQAVNLLRKSELSQAQRDQNLSIIHRQTNNLGRLLDDLLDVSRINIGQLVLRKEHVDLKEILVDAIGTIQTKARLSKLNVRYSTQSTPVYLDGDRLRLQQVLANLLDNAVKYTPAGGHIDIVVQVGEAEVQIEIIDDGIGIPEGKMDEVFRMFGRVANPGVDVGGLGVGLALVKDLVERHNGRIWARSAGVGQGSCFTVTFPLSSVQSGSSSLTLSSNVVNSGLRRVVIADDNSDIAFTLHALLEMEGHQVRCASNGKQAISLCTDDMPDVALLDIGMPVLDGYEAASSIRALPGGEKIFLVALSGWGRPEDVRKALDAGFDSHLTKPPDLDILMRLVSCSDRSSG